MLLTIFFFFCSGAHRHLLSFPTRRSSDLGTTTGPFTIGGSVVGLSGTGLVLQDNGGDDLTVTRSEEHTSELQSLTKLVCRLLLEKKNIKTTPSYRDHSQHDL